MPHLFDVENPRSIPWPLRWLGYVFFMAVLAGYLTYHIVSQPFGYKLEFLILAVFAASTALCTLIIRRYLLRRILIGKQLHFTSKREVVLKNGLMISYWKLLRFSFLLVFPIFLMPILIVGYYDRSALKMTSVNFFLLVMGWNLIATRLVKTTFSGMKRAVEHSAAKKYTNINEELSLQIRIVILDNSYFSLNAILFSLLFGSIGGIFDEDTLSIVIFCMFLAVSNIWLLYKICLFFKF